jgi:hypothetical protein
MITCLVAGLLGMAAKILETKTRPTTEYERESQVQRTQNLPAGLDLRLRPPEQMPGQNTDKLIMTKIFEASGLNHNEKHWLKKVEVEAIVAFGGNLNVQTPRLFLTFFLKSGILLNDDRILNGSDLQNRNAAQLLKLLRQFSESFLDYCLEDTDFYKTPSHTIAATAIFLARIRVGIAPPWPAALQAMTQLPMTGLIDTAHFLSQGMQKRRPEEEVKIREHYPLLTVEDGKVSSIEIYLNYYQSQNAMEEEIDFIPIKRLKRSQCQDLSLVSSESDKECFSAIITRSQTKESNISGFGNFKGSALQESKIFVDDGNCMDDIMDVSPNSYMPTGWEEQEALWADTHGSD